MTRPPLMGDGELLRPVQEALLERARRSAEEIIGEGEADARRIVADARTEADQVLVRAREEGETAASRAASANLLVARAEARALVLGAHRRVFDSLRQSAIHELEECSETPDARSLADRMAAMARQRVGEPAVVCRSGPGGLDVSAEARGRRAVLRLATLVDHELGTMGPELEGLWA